MIANLTQAPQISTSVQTRKKNDVNPFQDVTTGKELAIYFGQRFIESQLKPARQNITRLNKVRLNTGVFSRSKKGEKEQGQFSIEIDLEKNQYVLYLGEQAIVDAYLERNAPRVLQILTRKTELLKQENELGKKGFDNIMKRIREGELFIDAKITSVGKNADGGKQLTLKVYRSPQIENSTINLTGTITIDTDKQGRPRIFVVEVGANSNKHRDYRRIIGTQITNYPAGERITDPNIQASLQQKIKKLS